MSTGCQKDSNIERQTDRQTDRKTEKHFSLVIRTKVVKNCGMIVLIIPRHWEDYAALGAKI